MWRGIRHYRLCRRFEAVKAGLRERIGLLLLAALLASSFAALALWQYQRGVGKQQFLNRWQSAIEAPSVPLQSTMLGAPIEFPRAVAAELRPVPRFRWLLLDNQRSSEGVGLRAYGLFAADEAEPALLVDWGWLPLAADRALPPIPEPPAAIAVEGLLVPWPGQGLRLAEVVWDRSTAPVLLTTLKRAELEAIFARPIAAGVLRVAPGGDFGFSRQLDALPNTLSPEKHFGYALQWAGLSLTVLVVAALLWSRSMRK